MIKILIRFLLILLLLAACQSFETQPEICDDGIDNDGDNMYDCADLDCSEDIVCQFNNTNNTNNNNNINNINNISWDFFPTSTNKNIDLLFVVDNSYSMKEEQTKLRNDFSSLMQVLRNISGGLPNIHLGVISTDLGTAPYDTVSPCDNTGGDNGMLLKGNNNSCANPINQNYIVDVEPQNCNIEKSGSNNEVCVSHDCSTSNCQFQGEPNDLILQDNQNGCPRCRNYENQNIEEVFSCTADLGISGCGFEQPLEALYHAFEENNPENTGFFRENAIIAIFFLTDEDDCSASTGNLFNPENDAIDSTLGPLSAFRCTEFGIKCDEDWEREMQEASMTMHNCHARLASDPDALLFGISKYTNLLTDQYDPAKIIIGAIAGPYDNTLIVSLDNSNKPTLSPSCTDSGGTGDAAVPAVRIKEFVESFATSQDDMNWAYTSICEQDYSPALLGLGNKIKDLIEEGMCPPTPILDCPDPAAANGVDPITQLEPQERESCIPSCTVHDLHPNDTLTEIHPCAPNAGPNTDGHPPEIWNELTEPCYHIIYNHNCDQGSSHAPSRGAGIIISRKEYPPIGTISQVTCNGFPLTEEDCTDQTDNDFDGLTDGADSDCQ